MLLPSEQAWYSGDARAHRFEALVAELHLFLREAERRFTSLESELPWHVLHGEKVTPARLALIEQLEDSFVPSFVSYANDIDAALRATPPAHAKRFRAFSRALLHDHFMLSPLMHRCLTKPLGYPGDYVVMRYLYENRFEGTSLMAKAVHLGGTSTPACDAVRARKDMVRGAICAKVLERAKLGLRTRVISVAAGPAQETIELLEQAPEINSNLDVLLFDQDRDALEYVNNRVAMARSRGAGRDMTIQLRHDSIRRLLEDAAIFEPYFQADIIFASGLFDYLRFGTGVKLIRNLFSNLAPGGQLYVGNIVPEQPTRWIFDHHLDWFLEYRTREQLMTMAEDAVSDGNVTVIEEATGHNPFARLSRG